MKLNETLSTEVDILIVAQTAKCENSQKNQCIPTELLKHIAKRDVFSLDLAPNIRIFRDFPGLRRRFAFLRTTYIFNIAYKIWKFKFLERMDTPYS